jgi:PAS domain S-box-containing protein
VYGSDVKPTAKVSLADRPHFMHLRDDAQAGLVISKPQVSRANNKMVIVLARRLTLKDGAFGGMVFAAIPLEYLTRTFANLDVGENGVVALRDGELAMVARYPESPVKGLAIGSKTAAPELHRLVQSGQTFSTYRTDKLADKVERTVSFRKLGDYPLYVVVGRASMDYLADARAEAKKIIGLVSIFVLVSFVLAGMAYLSWRRQRMLNRSLHESEMRLNELFENMSSGVAIYRASTDGQDFVFSGFNRAAERLDSSRRADLIGKNVVEVFPGVVELGLLDVFKRVWKTGASERFPLSFYHDGRISGWRDNFVYKLPSGEVVAIYDDVTERMQAEQAVRLSEARYRATFDHVAVGIARVSTAGLFLEINPMFCRIIGYSQEEVLSQNFTFQQITVSEDLVQDMAQVQRLLDGNGDHYDMEKRYIRKDGAVVWVYLSVALLRDIDGKALYFISSVVDITARKQAEEKLKESEFFLRTMIDNEPECIKIVDDHGVLLQMNPAGLAMIEADSLAQVAGQPVLGVIAPEYRKAFAAMHKRVLAGEAVQMKFEVLGLKGGRRMLETHAVPMLDHGKVVHLAVTRDISERQKAEDALQRSNADLERFAYSVSHDMRQPLRAVSGHLQLLQRSLKDKLDEDERENLNFALDGAKRMDSMIVSLLDYSRVGRKTEAMQWMSSRTAVDEALGFLTPLVNEVKAEVRLGGEWPQIFASRDEMSRLFQNLIGNAIKFREPSQSALVEIESAVQGQTWRVSVRDHGVGIDPKQIDRLFQFFSRLQSRSRFEGTGMGLALCRRIVEHHDGRIWAESEGEGKGSVFIFELPLAATQEA